MQKTKKTKLLFVLESYFPNVGGVETLFKNLCEELVKKGFDVTVLTSDGDKYPEEQRLNNVRIYRAKSRSRYTFILFSFLKLLNLARNTDLIHTSSYSAALPAFISAKIFRKKTIITFHEFWGDLWLKLPDMNFIFRLSAFYFEKLIARLNFTKFVAVSEFTKAKLIEAGVNEKKIIRIYNGIDYYQFEKFKKSNLQNNASNGTAFNYLYFGRLGYSKGIDILLDATLKVRETVPNSKFTIIIPNAVNAYYKKLERFIDLHNLHKYYSVRQNLSSEELYAEILSNNCVVIPSYSEGFCYAAVEASALGSTIVSSGKGALKETVSGNHLIYNEQTSDSLAEAIIKFSRGEFDKSPVKRFPLESTIENYLNLYTDLIDKE